jgi:hypothetical protein
MQALSPEKIQVRAYELWEQEGRPDGKADEHWYRAATELTDGNGSAVNGDAKKSRKKAAAPAANVEPAEKPKKKTVKKAN